MNDFFNLIQHSDLTPSAGPGNPAPIIVLFIIILAFAVGMFIGFVYMWTHDALSYSRTFVGALGVMPLIVAMLMLVYRVIPNTRVFWRAAFAGALTKFPAD